MQSLDSFVLDTPRPLPVILLLDVSGSMQGAKIAALNAAVRELCQDLADTRQPQGEIHLGRILFSSSVIVDDPVPASKAKVEELHAGGSTLMGAAIDRLVDMLEDKDRVSSRSYTPTVVLVSDGQPTDHFDRALTALLQSERGGRATRMALAIGDDADVEVLKRFVANPEVPVVRAGDVARIREFFRWVTYSVQIRSKSRNPDDAQIASPSLADIPDDDLVF